MALLMCLIPWSKKQNDGGMYAITALADSDDLIEVQAYFVDMNVRTDRKVEVKERITVKFLEYDLTMFYRSLPTKGCKYENFVATCEGNGDFSYEVAYNPDIDGFIDVNCIGGVKKDAVWTYEIRYTMLQGVKSDGMQIDVIGFGWSVPLHNVTATVHLPVAISSKDATVYKGGYGASHAYGYELSADAKTLTIRADKLSLTYNDTYGERMAEGITVDCTLPAGVLDSYADVRMFTEDVGALLLFAGIVTALGALLRIFKKKREIIPVVAVKPPKGMSPMQMGKILDGSVDTEDVTSMIYYFAHKGYLKIDFTDEKDPEFIRLTKTLPDDAPLHEKTLFDGLFAEGSYKMMETETGEKKEIFTVRSSELVLKFYESMEKAKLQVKSPKPMYEGKSVFSIIFGSLLGGIYAFVGGLLMGLKLGGGFLYPLGGVLLIPLAVNLLLAWISENYRYKWKKKTGVVMRIVRVLIALVFTAVFTAFFADHVMTEWEKIVLCVGAFAPAFLTHGTLVRTEEYSNELGEILGFREFIVVTEEDKIKFMLEEYPELFYEVLPYAQALGVTDEWEKKFAKITLQPPTWYEGDGLTVFDYLILNRCMSVAMMNAMAAGARQAQGGGHIGSSGGGGGFGGFGGGGFGGGGGGAR